MAFDIGAIFNDLPTTVQKLNDALAHLETLETKAFGEADHLAPEVTHALEGVRSGLEAAVPLAQAIGPIVQTGFALAGHLGFGGHPTATTPKAAPAPGHPAGAQ
jgi:hypothetical protein